MSAVRSVKHLEVQLTHDMSWKNHVLSVVLRASRTLGFLKHSLYESPSNVKAVAYKTIFRPVMEYACEVWDPSQQYLKNNFEDVQRKAVRFMAILRGWNVFISQNRKMLAMASLEK